MRSCALFDEIGDLELKFYKIWVEWNGIRPQQVRPSPPSGGDNSAIGENR